MKYFIANWKANKNLSEIKEWTDIFIAKFKPLPDITVGICPPAAYISYMKKRLENVKNIYIGAQTISSFESGSYTGELTAASLQGEVRFAIIGHSERRKHFKETDEELALKVNQAKKYGIEPVYCVRDEKDPIPNGIKYIAYEPVWAIGTGKNEDLAGVLAMKKRMKLPPECVFIYGGSVHDKNVGEYLSSDEIDGFLIGKASLDADIFVNLINTKLD